MFTTERAGTGQQRASSSPRGSGIWCFFEEEAFDDDGRAAHGQGAEHQQDRARDARPRPDLRDVQLHARARRRRRRHRARRRARPAEHVHLQAAAASAARSAATRTRTFLYTDPMTVTGFWFAIEDATLRERLPVGQARAAIARRCARSSSAPAPPTTTARLFDELDDDAAARRRPTSWCRSRRRPARWSSSTACCPTGATSTAPPISRHAYSLHCISGAADYPTWNWLQRPARHAAALGSPGSPR